MQKKKPVLEPTRSNNLSTEWTRGIESEASREEVLRIIKASTILRERLAYIATARLEEIESRQYSEKDFEDPNWSEKQAFRNGRMSELRKVLQLVTLN
mgnify:CR=1 FL=1